MGHGDEADFEATVRRALERLTVHELPRAAAARGWPVRTPAEFRRLLFEHLRDRPAGVTAAGSRNPCLIDMILAVELGERLLSGRNCCTKMSQRQACDDDGLAALRRLLATAPRRTGPDPVDS
jgi:hypothetical protein